MFRKALVLLFFLRILIANCGFWKLVRYNLNEKNSQYDTVRML